MKSLLALLFSFFHFLFPGKLITISFKSHHHFYSRWKRTSGGVMLDGGKKVLEFVAIQRRDNSQWAIPGVSLNYCKPSRDHSLIRSKACARNFSYSILLKWPIYPIETFEFEDANDFEYEIWRGFFAYSYVLVVVLVLESKGLYV